MTTLVWVLCVWKRYLFCIFISFHISSFSLSLYLSVLSVWLVLRSLSYHYGLCCAHCPIIMACAALPVLSWWVVLRSLSYHGVCCAHWPIIMAWAALTVLSLGLVLRSLSYHYGLCCAHCPISMACAALTVLSLWLVLRSLSYHYGLCCAHCPLFSSIVGEYKSDAFVVMEVLICNFVTYYTFYCHTNLEVEVD
jgi:hypothetical protein